MSKHSAEHLEVLGKNASARYRAGQATTLTEAVIDVVKTAGLLPEQVQRVVEHANTDAFLTQFRKEGSHKVVELPGGPASPFAVLQSLNQPASMVQYNRGTGDYDHPPTEKRASSDELDYSLKQAFRIETPAEYPYADPMAEVYALQQKLASVEATMTGQLSLLEGAFGDMVGRVYEGVKQAALEGINLGDVVQAWATAPGATPEHVKLAFNFVGPRLVKAGVFQGANALGASLEKYASGRLVNPEHPLVIDFGEFCEVVTKLAEIRTARTEISSGLGQINYYLKHAAADPGLLKQIYSASGQAGKMVGGGAERAARVLLGPSSPHAATVGKVVGKAVEHLPTAGAAIAANEARRALKYNPTYQGVKDTALSVMPGTSQYQQREYELAMNGQGVPMPMGY